MGGNDSRILQATGKLQILQPIAVSSSEEGNLNRATGNRIYVGIIPHPSHILGIKEKEKKEKEQKGRVKNDSGIDKGGKKKMEKTEKLV